MSHKKEKRGKKGKSLQRLPVLSAHNHAREQPQHKKDYNIMTTPAILTTRLRQLGHCPPSLLVVEETKLDDSFLLKVANLVQDGKAKNRI